MWGVGERKPIENGKVCEHRPAEKSGSKQLTTEAFTFVREAVREPVLRGVDNLV